MNRSFRGSPPWGSSYRSPGTMSAISDVFDYAPSSYSQSSFLSVSDFGECFPSKSMSMDLPTVTLENTLPPTKKNATAAAPAPIPAPVRANRNPRRTAHPMRSHTAPQLYRQSERKVNFVQCLVESATLIVQAIWPLSAATPCQGYQAAKSPLKLRTFIEETLRRSRTSYSTLQVAMYYLILIKPHVPKQEFSYDQDCDMSTSSRALQCGRRMFLVTLILASKYLQDRNYSAKAWSKMSGLPIAEINHNEIAFLKAINWKLHIPEDLFMRWTTFSLNYPPPPSGAGFGMYGTGKSEATKQWQQMILDLNVDITNVDLTPKLQLSLPAILRSSHSLSPKPPVLSPVSRAASISPPLPGVLNPTSHSAYSNAPMSYAQHSARMESPPQPSIPASSMRAAMEHAALSKIRNFHLPSSPAVQTPELHASSNSSPDSVASDDSRSSAPAMTYSIVSDVASSMPLPSLCQLDNSVQIPVRAQGRDSSRSSSGIPSRFESVMPDVVRLSEFGTHMVQSPTNFNEEQAALVLQGIKCQPAIPISMPSHIAMPIPSLARSKRSFSTMSSDSEVAAMESPVRQNMFAMSRASTLPSNLYAAAVSMAFDGEATKRARLSNPVGVPFNGFNYLPAYQSVSA